MSMYFEIDGYWKDDRSEFGGFIVKEYNDALEGEDDDVFYYGLSERDIQGAIEDGKNGITDALEFVITDYKVMDYV